MGCNDLERHTGTLDSKKTIQSSFSWIHSTHIMSPVNYNFTISFHYIKHCIKMYCICCINLTCVYFRTYSAMDGHLCKHIAFLPALCRLVSPHRKEASDALSLLQTSLILGSLHNEDSMHVGLTRP